MNQPSSQRAQRPFKLPTEPQFLAWALIVAVAILSFFVHTLHDGIDRGETFRAAQRAGSVGNGTSTSSAPALGWARPMAVVADTRSSR